MGDLSEPQDSCYSENKNGHTGSEWRFAAPTSPTKMADRVDNMTSNGLLNVKITAKYLARDIIQYATGNRRPAANIHSRTLRRTVDEMLQKHEIPFRSMVTKLDFCKNNDHQTLLNVLNELFIDNVFNWGRVVAVYAFIASLSRHVAAKGIKNDYLDRIEEFAGEYIAENIAPWIHKQGGWDKFVEFFPERNSTENKIWNGLLFTVFGLGAIATMIAAR